MDILDTSFVCYETFHTIAVCFVATAMNILPSDSMFACTGLCTNTVDVFADFAVPFYCCALTKNNSVFKTVVLTYFLIDVLFNNDVGLTKADEDFTHSNNTFS